MRKRMLLILVGPSGAGKDTIIERILREVLDVRTTKSYTTREARLDDHRYIYVSVEEFERRRDAGEFVEFKQVHGKFFYATPRFEFAQDGDIIMQADIRGALTIKE